MLLTISLCILSSALEMKQQTGTWMLSFRPAEAASTPKSWWGLSNYLSKTRITTNISRFILATVSLSRDLNGGTRERKSTCSADSSSAAVCARSSPAPLHRLQDKHTHPPASIKLNKMKRKWQDYAFQNKGPVECRSSELRYYLWRSKKIWICFYVQTQRWCFKGFPTLPKIQFQELKAFIKPFILLMLNINVLNILGYCIFSISFKRLIENKSSSLRWKIKPDLLPQSLAVHLSTLSWYTRPQLGLV